MCWSLEVSLASWVVGIAGIIYLALRNNTNDAYIAISAGVFVQMQLVDALMWSQQDKGCTNIVKFASILGFLLIFAEPLANILALFRTKNANKPGFKKAIISAASVYGFLLLILFSTSFPTSEDALCPEYDCRHIKWNFFNDIKLHNIVYVLWFCSFFIPLVFVDTTIGRIVYPIFGLTLVSFVYLFAPHVFGNVWCWSAILTIFLAIFLNPALTKGKYWNNFKVKKTRGKVSASASASA